MRNGLCRALVTRSAQPDMVFLTGDLGFMALEPLQAALGERFINCGIAEQNMVSVAAALASEGMEPWVYSIAPFIYARAFEQIRNDVCAHDLPVRLLGNGGGYGYGVMGQTHYSLEDYGAMLTLPRMRVYAPVFGADVGPVIEAAGRLSGPAYLRLGRCELPQGFTAPAYLPWRPLLQGDGPVIVAVGALAGGVWSKLAAMNLEETRRPNLWCVTEMPVSSVPPPPEFIEILRQQRRLIVAEEHVDQGSFASQLCLWLMERGVPVEQFRHLCAVNAFAHDYGSQNYMRKQAGMDAESICSCALNLN